MHQKLVCRRARTQNRMRGGKIGSTDTENVCIDLIPDFLREILQARARFTIRVGNKRRIWRRHFEFLRVIDGELHPELMKDSQLL